MNISELSAEQLKRAAKIKTEIESLQSQLTKILGAVISARNGDEPVGASKKTRGRRRMSAAGRARIAAAAKARWAKAKAAGKKHL